MPALARRVATRIVLGGAVVGVTAALAGCGDISKDSAVSQLSSQFAASSITLPNGLTPGTLAQCLADKLYDSGKFSSDEIQKVLKANSSSDLPKDLQDRYTTVVQTPCLAGGAATTSGAASSTNAGGQTDTGASSAATSS